MDENWLANVPILGNLCKNWDKAIKFIEKYTNLTQKGAKALLICLIPLSTYGTSYGIAKLILKYQDQQYQALLQKKTEKKRPTLHYDTPIQKNEKNEWN